MFAIEIHMHSLSSFKLTLHVQLKKIIFSKIIYKKTIKFSNIKQFLFYLFCSSIVINTVIVTAGTFEL